MPFDAPLILKNCLRNRRRSILTILSIAASFCLLGVLMAMYYAFYIASPSPDQSLRLITRNRISITNFMPLSYRDRIKGVPGVREVSVYQWFGGVYKDSRDLKNFFPRFAVEPEKLIRLHPEYHLSDEERVAFERERTACIMGRSLAERLGLHIGDHVTIVGDIYSGVTLELTLRGLYDSVQDNENCFFSWTYLSESISARARDRIGMFALMANNPDEVPLVAKRIDALFRNAPEETKTESEHAFALNFLGYIGNVKLFLLSICGALTFTVLLVAANTMAMSVRERVGEVGILKTLGYTRESILGLIVAESMLLALIGGLLGLGLAGGIVAGLHRLPTVFVDLKGLTIPIPVSGLSLLMAMLLGAASAVVPAWSASRMSIVEALRFND